MALIPSRRGLAALSFLALSATLAACGSDAPTGVDDSETSLAARGGAPAGGSAPGASNTSASRCNGTIGAVTVNDIAVPANATCTLDGTRVRGNITVGTNGTLVARAVRVDGSIQAEDALALRTSANSVINGDIQAKRRAAVRIEATTIIGNLQIEEQGTSLITSGSRIGGNLQVSKAASADITGAVVGGDIQLDENRGALQATGADVRGNFQVVKNIGGVRLDANRIAQTLECKENAPAPIGSGNIAGEKKEQCRAL